MQGHGPGGDLTKLLKQPLPALLRLLVGHSTNVVALQVCCGIQISVCVDLLGEMLAQQY